MSHALLGAFFRTLHGLGRHRLLGAPLHRWLLLVLLLGALFAWMGWIPGGSAQSASIRAGLAAALLALALFLAAGQVWARRRFYVYFFASNTEAPVGAPLPPEARLAALASGLFGVDERSEAFSNLPAFYRTYPSREHAILARKTPTRFLGLTDADPDQLGMWYIFIAPQALLSVRGGAVWLGPSPQPGLRIEYMRKNKKHQPVPALIFLGFADQTDRDRVWADLLFESHRGCETPE